MSPRATQPCLFCGGDASAPDHRERCDGRQGHVDARDDNIDDIADPIVDLARGDGPMPPPPMPDDDPRAGSIAERAARFHARNPQVYLVAVRIARGVKGMGQTRYGIGAIWEIMRFSFMRTKGDIYKLGNSYRAWYARLIMANEPDLSEFFITRDCPNDPDYRTRKIR